MANKLTETKAAKDVLETYIKSLITKTYIQNTLKGEEKTFTDYILSCLKGKTIKCRALWVEEDAIDINIKTYIGNRVKAHTHSINIDTTGRPRTDGKDGVLSPWGLHSHTIDTLGRIVPTAALTAQGASSQWYVNVNVKGKTGIGIL